MFCYRSAPRNFFFSPQTFFFAFWAKFTRYMTLTGRLACCPRTFACHPRTFACRPGEVRKVCENEALFKDFGEKNEKKQKKKTFIFPRYGNNFIFFLPYHKLVENHAPSVIPVYLE